MGYLYIVRYKSRTESGLAQQFDGAKKVKQQRKSAEKGCFRDSLKIYR